MRGTSLVLWSSGLMLSLALLGARPAAAGPPSSPSKPSSIEAPESTPKIYGGEPTATCEWPSTVSMGGNCTGTLVHPEIVVYAGHCGGVPWVWFGENLANTPAGRFVDTEYCEVNPDFNGIGSNTDFAFCKLVEPVTEVEIVPILIGCETDLLQPGTEVVAVGYGLDEADNYGVKRSVGFPIVSVDGEVQAGGDGKSICNGDSGGPLFLRLAPEVDPEQSWRVFGVTSWGPADCAQAQYFGTMHAAVPWIEARSGIDITPCHNADGSWQAGPDCGGFPLDPGAGAGDWASWCEDQPLGGASASCGDPTALDDLDPPLVSIIDPLDEAVFSSDPDTQKAAVAISGEASDVGWGLASVELRINGAAITNGSRIVPPWTWSGNFPAGGYVLQLVGTDLYGNVAKSEPVHIGVDQDPPEPEPEPDPGETETGGGADEIGETGGLDPALAGDEGCACASEGSGFDRGRGGWAWLVLGGLALGWRRRGLSRR